MGPDFYVIDEKKWCYSVYSSEERKINTEKVYNTFRQAVYSKSDWLMCSFVNRTCNSKCGINCHVCWRTFVTDFNIHVLDMFKSLSNYYQLIYFP